MSSRPRIVSLVPSSTETLLGLGAGVVACTRFCEEPTLPHVGGTKNPDIAAIVALQPDVVVMDRQENRREDARALDDAGVTLFVSDVTTVAEAHAVVGDLAALAGCDVPASGPTTPTSAAPALGTDERTVFVPIWRRPWMTIGRATYGADVLAAIGCRLVSTDPDDPYPTIDLAAAAVLAPDAVLIPSEPYEFTDAHLGELRATFGVDVPLVRVDGRDLFWWGLRTPAAIVRLRASLSGMSPPPT